MYIVELVKGQKVKLYDRIRYYKPYELDKIDSVDEISNMNDLEIPKTKIQENKQKHYLKRENVDLKNIIPQTRRAVKRTTRAKNPIYK